MDVHLTADLEHVVEGKMKSGQFASANDVIREALRLMQQLDRMLELKKGNIRGDIEQGLQSLREGRGIDGEEVFDRIERELDRIEDKHGE